MNFSVELWFPLPGETAYPSQIEVILWIVQVQFLMRVDTCKLLIILFKGIF